MLRHLASLFLAGTVMEILWLLSYSLGPLRAHSGSFVALMLTLFGICLWAYLYCPVNSPRKLALVLGFALVFRLSLLPAPPDQSEDVYRYLWDGRLSALGMSPYRYAPDAKELESYRDRRIYPMLNSKPYITAYPPLSQGIFHLCYRLFGADVLPMKAVFSLLEFSALLVAWRLLHAFGAGRQALLLMAWNPFFIFEFSHSGHSDSSMIFLILLSLLLMHRSRRIWAAVCYAGAILAKLHPALWFPLYLRRLGWKANAAALSILALCVPLFFTSETWLPYLKSLRLYYKLFEFNAGIHYFLRFAGNTLFGQSWDKLTGPYLGAALLLITGLIVWRFPVRDSRSLLHAGFWIMTADLCLATTVHPWYISWAALALPFFPYAFMMYWTGASFLSYLAYGFQPVREPAWVLLVEYLPMYALMGWEIYRGSPCLLPRFTADQTHPPL